MMFRPIASCLAMAMMTNAWTPVPPTLNTPGHSPSALKMAMDYNDPVVAAEFAQVQPMAYEDVEAELAEKGIPVPPTMNDMEIKLMLVEMRLRMSGQLAGQTKPQRPATYSSKFEEAMWEKPAFEEYYNMLKTKDDHNAMNVVAEYVNDPELATQRYGKDYKAVLRKAEAALTAPPPVKSPTLNFSGFPANMGEAGCKMTLQALGEITEFECVADDTFPILRGTVTFEDIEDAKKAVEQYNGMDMGGGSKLEVVSAA